MSCDRRSLGLMSDYVLVPLKIITFTYIMITSPELAEPAITVIHHFPLPSSLYFP